MIVEIKPKIISSGNTHIVYNAHAVSSFDADRFQELCSLPPPIHSPSLGKGRGAASVVTVADRSCVLKHYHRGGLVAGFLVDRYLYTGLDRTRSFAEWRLLSLMHKRGLPVPIPFAARCCRHGLFYTADLISEYCQGTQTLAQLLSHEPLPNFLWRKLGHTLRRFHDCGIYHADLNAHNILLNSENGEVTLVDFDRAFHSRHPFFLRRNMARLQGSLNKSAGEGECPAYRREDFQALLDSYEKPVHPDFP